MSDNSTSKKNNKNWKIIRFSLGIMLFLGLSAVIIAAMHTSPESHGKIKITQPTSPPNRVPDPVKYKELIEEVEKKRTELGNRYNSSRSNQRKQIINEARAYIETVMPQLMQCWVGTPWDFNGTSQTPGKGKIACGYFVSVILRDAGFKVSRISLAQQPSQNIIITMIQSEDKKVMRYDQDYNDFLKQFKAMPNGIYIIGLDTHVGYLINLADKIYFAHSGARGVIKELPGSAWDIEQSRYRVVGNITKHNYVIKKWLLQEPFHTKR